jgi:hypothetical protein
MEGKPPRWTRIDMSAEGHADEQHERNDGGDPHDSGKDGPQQERT